MAMTSSSQIRDRLAMYLDNRLDLKSFEDWFVENTWNIHQTGSTAAESLTFSIEEALADFSRGNLNTKRLQTELEHILDAETKTAHIAYEPQALWSPAPILSFTATRPSVITVALPA